MQQLLERLAIGVRRIEQIAAREYSAKQSGAGIGAGFAGNALSEGSIVLQ